MRNVCLLITIAFLSGPALAHDPENGIKFVRAYDYNNRVVVVLVSNTSVSKGKYISCVGFDTDKIPLFQRELRTEEFATQFDQARMGIRAARIKDVKCVYKN